MPRPRLIIFLGIFSLFLYIANLVVYEALASIFFLQTTEELALLGVLLCVFSGSFVAATMLGMRYYNWFTRAYYTLSAVWIGTFTYLFFVSVLYGLLAILPWVVPAVLGYALVALAVGVSIYGVLHARTLVIKEVAISFPNLPARWQGRKAVWVSDLHLGQLHGPAFASKVVKKINALSHDIIFIGGDLFDGTGAPDIDELVAPLRDLQAKLGTYFITGNHEEFGDNTKFIAAIKALGIRVLIDERVDMDGMQILGVDYHNASDASRFKDILARLSISPEKPSILLKHEPKDLDVAEAAGVSLQISGHTHRAQLWPLRYVAELTYKGYAYGLKPFIRMQVFTSSGTGSWGPPLRVGTNSEIVVFTFGA